MYRCPADIARIKSLEGTIYWLIGCFAALGLITLGLIYMLATTIVEPVRVHSVFYDCKPLHKDEVQIHAFDQEQQVGDTVVTYEGDSILILKATIIQR